MRRLLIRPGAIGDLIVSLPALESLRAEYTEVWVAEQNVPLVRFADVVRSIGSTGLDMLEIDPPAGLAQRLRGFDSIISWYGSNRVEFRDAVARAGLRFQFFSALPSDAKVHATDFYLRQAGACLTHTSNPPPTDVARALGARSRPGGRLQTRGSAPPDCGEIRGHFRGSLNTAGTNSDAFAVIHPFASSPRKRWPLEKFREVARRLTIPVRWCAGPNEELSGAVRIGDLHELGCWLARARVYIGNDSGISHLAAHAGTRTIVLFGPTDPAVWAPRGSRVLYPMDSIEPADVVAAVEGI